MEEKYLSLAGETVTEKTIEKSRFITISRHVCGEEQAKAFIEEISSHNFDATHNCYAYIADKLGNTLRFSDNGEPQGTAGMPMLEVLKARKLCEVAVVVTRYFGGIKLGAGGLVRAYSGCVAENIAAAQIVSYEPCVENAYVFAYTEADAATRFFASRGADILASDYGNEVTFKAAVRKSEEQSFNDSLINAVHGRVRIKKEREYFFPFSV